jgi:hypothetical protein
MPISILIIWSVLNDGHDWRGDFAMYVSQAQSILDGTVNELYAMNVYSMDHSETVLGPYLYQFGFPLLLAPVLALFGLNFFALKWLCSAGLVLAIPLMFRLFRLHFRSGFYPTLIVSFIAFHSAYVIFCDSILSDLPFLGFSMLALVLIPKRPTGHLFLLPNPRHRYRSSSFPSFVSTCEPLQHHPVQWLSETAGHPLSGVCFLLFDFGPITSSWTRKPPESTFY